MGLSAPMSDQPYSGYSRLSDPIQELYEAAYGFLEMTQSVYDIFNTKTVKNNIYLRYDSTCDRSNESNCKRGICFDSMYVFIAHL